MVDVSSGDKKINITVSTSGNKASVNATPDMAMYYSNKSREWAISSKIVDGEDYSSKYYANVSKKQAETVKDKITEVNNAVEEGITNIINQENISVDNVNTAGETQVNLAKEQATIATTQAGIATAKTSEVIESGNAAITAITEQETTSKNNIETKGTEQIELIQNEGATQVANVQSTGFYMRDDKLYYINSQGEETEFKSGGSGLEVCDIGMALYVDETKGLRRYLNGQIVDINTNTQAFLKRLKQITTLHPSLLCTEDEWQTTATMTVGGQVGKFVVDDDAGTIRLPKIIMPIQGLTDLSKLGEIVEAGLPNIGGTTTISDAIGFHANNLSGAFYSATSSKTLKAAGVGSATTHAILGLDASLSNPIYGNSNTVQQEAIQYPYFIQVATGAETEDNIINEIELNNPFSLLDYKYSEYELNNISWLRSNGQYNSKAVYPAVYDLLLKIYNGTETKAGVSVKLSTETFTDYDFVLNTAEETFMLPTKVKLASGKAVVGNGKALGITDGATNYGLISGDDGKYGKLMGTSNNYGMNVGSGFITGGASANDDLVLGVTTDPTKSGIETSDSNLYLYFYVGETVQNANLINAGRIEEQLHSMIPDNSSIIAGYAMPSNKYIDLTLGASGAEYTAPANGYVFIGKQSTATGQKVNIHSTNPVTQASICWSTNENQALNAGISVKKGQKFICHYSAGGILLEFRFVYAEGSN